jgi:hypothetical protein
LNLSISNTIADLLIASLSLTSGTASQLLVSPSIPLKGQASETFEYNLFLIKTLSVWWKYFSPKGVQVNVWIS